VFVDDRRALALASVDGGMELRELSFDNGPTVRWRQRVPGLRSGDITYGADENGWVVLGRDSNSYFVRAAGTLGATGYDMNTWPNLSSRGGWIQAIGARGESALVVDQRYEFGLLARLLPWRLASVLTRSYPETHLAQAGRSGRSEVARSLFEAACDALHDGRVLCAAFDGRRTRIATIEPDTAAIGPLAAVDGRFWVTDVSSHGWIAGWNDSTPVALRLSTREVIGAPYRRDEFTSAIAATDAIIATVAARPGSSRVRLYQACQGPHCSESAPSSPNPAPRRTATAVPDRQRPQ
jgi:hypothetical protein